MVQPLAAICINLSTYTCCAYDDSSGKFDGVAIEKCTKSLLALAPPPIAYWKLDCSALQNLHHNPSFYSWNAFQPTPWCGATGPCSSWWHQCAHVQSSTLALSSLLGHRSNRLRCTCIPRTRRSHPSNQRHRNGWDISEQFGIAQVGWLSFRYSSLGKRTPFDNCGLCDEQDSRAAHTNTFHNIGRQ